MATSVSGLTTIDVNTIVSQLMTVERQPLTAMKTSLSGIQTRLSALGRLQGQLAAFQAAAQGLARAERWQATSAASGDDAAARVTSSGSAQPGGHTLQVDALAQRQAIASQPWSGADAIVGGGTLRLQYGRIDTGTGTLSADPARPEIPIAVPAGATLAQVRDAINAAGAGVSASLVSDGGAVRLAIRGDDTGASNAFSLTADGDPGLAAFSFAPGAASTTMALTQSASDALFSIDGLALSSPDNRLEDVLDGLTIELRRAGPGPVAIDVMADTAAMRTAIEGFASAWNELDKIFSELTRYDAATDTAGVLQGNGSVVSVQRRLRVILTGSVDGAALSRLSDAGLSLQRDGSLKLDPTRLESALADPARLQALFSANAATDASRGLARRFDALIGTVLGFDGALTGATESLQGQKDRVTRQQEAFEVRMGLVEARLRRQYTALDASLAQWSSASAFLASRFGDGS
jgi:flagellar hook-associated protein 2